MKTISYETESPLPYIYFEYPESWTISQAVGKGYKEIMVLGPRNIEDTFNLAMVVRFTPLLLNSQRLQLVADNYFSRRVKLSGFKLESRYTTKMEGVEAEIIEISFLSPKSFETLKPDYMEIKEKRILLINHSVLYEIIFTGTSSDFISYTDEFEKILISIRLQSSN